MELTRLRVCIDAPTAATTPMFSLQKLLGKSDVFFPLLQQSAQEVQRSITALRGMFAEPNEEKSIAEFTASRRRDKEITEKINGLERGALQDPQDGRENRGAVYDLPPENRGMRLLEATRDDGIQRGYRGSNGGRALHENAP
jgi:hypothetical protein